MRLSLFLDKIVSAKTELELRYQFMDVATKLVEAQAWGLDILDSQLRVIESELAGLPESFCERYRKLGLEADHTSQLMIEKHIPVHNLSCQSFQAWRQSKIYNHLFQYYGIEHSMVGPLVGNGRLLGGIYFIRSKGLQPFEDRDLIDLSALCMHLSACFAKLRIPTLAVNSSQAACLTQRELEIVELVAQGLTNQEIGVKLRISRDTVKQALKRIFCKLDVSARAEMVAKLKT